MYFSFLQQDSATQESKSRLGQTLKYLSDPKCKVSIEKLDLIRKEINCMLQLAMPRKPSSSLLHGQLSSNLRPVQQLLQQPSQSPQFLPPEDQKKPELQLINSQNSAITVQWNNVTNLQDVTLLPSFEPATLHQNGMRSQHLTKSDSGPGNSAKSVQQVSMRSLQIPASTLQQPNVNMLSQNQSNTPEPNVNSLNLSSVIPQHMHSKEKKEQRHVPRENLKQNTQQHQICPQIMPGKREIPQQKQQLSVHEIPQHNFDKVNDVNVRRGMGNERQLHHMDEVKNLKVRQGTAVKTGVQCKAVGQHQNMNSGVPVSSSLSLPRLPQSASLQIPQHSLQTNQQNLWISCADVGSSHHSLNSTSIVPSSTPLAPSPEPEFSEKLSSNALSLINAGNTGHQSTTGTVEPSSQFIVRTPGISVSPL